MRRAREPYSCFFSPDLAESQEGDRCGDGVSARHPILKAPAMINSRGASPELMVAGFRIN